MCALEPDGRSLSRLISAGTAAQPLMQTLEAAEANPPGAVNVRPLLWLRLPQSKPSEAECSRLGSI